MSPLRDPNTLRDPSNFTSAAMVAANGTEEWMNVFDNMDNFLEVDNPNETHYTCASSTGGGSQPKEGAGVAAVAETTNETSNNFMQADATRTTVSDTATVSSAQSSCVSAATSVSNSRKPTPSLTAAKELKSTKEMTAEEKAQARSERKRTRERQRRVDVNSQFADLSNILRKVETEMNEDSSDVDEPKYSPTTVPVNRVDLIARTISVLSRLHNRCKKRKREIVSLQDKLAAEISKSETMTQNLGSNGKQQEPMMMMVPMMVSPDGMSHMVSGGMPMRMPQQHFVSAQGIQGMNVFTPQQVFASQNEVSTSQNNAPTSSNRPQSSSNMPVQYFNAATPSQPQANNLPANSTNEHATQVNNSTEQHLPLKKHALKPQQEQVQNQYLGQMSSFYTATGGNLAHCA